MDDFDGKMRTQVTERLCKKLKLKWRDDFSNKAICDMIFADTGWDSPFYGKRHNYIEMYWRRFCFKATKAPGQAGQL